MIKLTAIIQQINGLCGTFKRFNSFHGLPIYTHNNSKGKSVWKNTINTSLKPVLLEILDIAHKDRFLVRMIQDDFFRSEEHTSELQSREKFVCRLLLEK